MNYKNIAVIGSNGFMGSHLTKKLIQVPGINLFLFGRNESSVFGDSIPYTKIDLTNKEQVNRCFADIDLVYYLASTSIPATSWDKPAMEIEQNLLPFINFMECLGTLKAKKVVFVSSAGTIYGPSEQKVTEDSFKNPFSPHGITKLAMEYFLNYFRVRYNINSDIYRVSNVYGEGQDITKGIGIINTFLENIIAHNRLNIFGDGKNVRNYLYVNDCSELLSLSLFTDPSKSEIYNVSSNDTLSINDLVEIIRDIIEEDFEVIYTAARKSDNSVIYLDNSKILKANPGFKLTGIKEGILQTYRHIKSRAATMV